MQEIIVYRNPVEAALWSGEYSGILIPILAGCIVFFLTFIINEKLFARSRFTYKKSSEWAMVLSSIATIFTVWKLWL
jgi:uncharacterized membrane protein YjjP (DUF1212 family)